MTLVPSGARCGLHAVEAAIDTCGRCGAFVCARCVNALVGEVRCPGCVSLRERPRERELPASLRRTVVLASLGILFPPAFLVAAVLTHSRLRPAEEVWDARAEQTGTLVRFGSLWGFVVWVGFAGMYFVRSLTER